MKSSISHDCETLARMVAINYYKLRASSQCSPSALCMDHCILESFVISKLFVH